MRWSQVILGVIVGALLGPGFASPLQGLQSPGELTGRLVDEVEFDGAQEVSTDALQRNIVTQPTRCRGLLLQPICWLGDWEVVTERHRLDTEVLPFDELRILVTYFRAGFRRASVSSEVSRANGRARVRFHIDEGPPTLLEQLDVEYTRQVLSRRTLERIPWPGEDRPFNLNRLDEALAFVEERLGDEGYLDARVEETVAVEEGARVEVIIDPGPRSTVRQIEIEGNEEVEDRTIRGGLLLADADVLTLPLIRQSRRTLFDTNLFHEVHITVPEVPDSAKTVGIRVREAPPRLGRVGAGMNTLEFGQVEARYTHYNWRGAGRRMDLRTTVGNLLAPQLNGRGIFRDVLPPDDLGPFDVESFRRPTWQASVEFAQPHFRGARNTVGLSLFSHRSVVPAVSVDEGFGGELSLTRRLAFRAPLSLTYRYELIRTEAGDVYFCVNAGVCTPELLEVLRGRRSLSPVGLDLHLDRSDHPLAPTTGYRVRAGVEHSSSFTLSDFGYDRVSGEVTYYRSFVSWPDHLLAGRLRAGWVGPRGEAGDDPVLQAAGPGVVHPRKRFFAGGSRSVRGYGENELGPRVLTVPVEVLLEEDRCLPDDIRNRTCDPNLAPADAFFSRPLGGTSVVEAGIEYRFPLGFLTAAAFLDGALVGGRLRDLVQESAFGLTPGVGVRFASPAGPIRIDLGVQGRERAELPVVTETPVESNGDLVERELVVLETLRLHDPLEERGTLGRILGRLTLHFSIGEAF